MFDLTGQGGTITINDRPAGTLDVWAYGPGMDKQLRVRATVSLHPLYRRLGIKEGSTATVVLNPREHATRPAYLTIKGTVSEYANGKIVISNAKQIKAEPVSESGGAAARDAVSRARRIRS